MVVRVTVVVLPGGDVARAQRVGSALIVNDGTGDEKTGNYRVSLAQMGRPTQIWRKGRLLNFPRKTLGPWDLVYRALHEVVGERPEKET